MVIRHMKRCSTSLITREIQIKTTMRYSDTWLKINNMETTGVGKDVERGESSYTVGGNANWCSHSGKQYEDSSKS